MDRRQATTCSDSWWKRVPLLVAFVGAVGLSFVLAAEAQGQAAPPESSSGSSSVSPSDHEEDEGGEGHHDEDDEFLFTEDGRALKDVVKRVYFSLSARMRGEYLENSRDFDDSFDDDNDFITNRFTIGIGAELAGNTGLFLELQNNSIWGDDSKFLNLDLTDDDDIKVYQGYFEARDVNGSGLGFKIGRQELVYGTEFLLGDSDFGAGLSHDVVKGTMQTGNLTIDAWWGKLIENDQTNPNNEDVSFAGIYSTFANDEGDSGFDLYWLNVHDRRSGAARGSSGVEDKRHTIGGRVFAEAGPFSFNSELAWQFGDHGPMDHNIKAFGWENNVLIGFEDSAIDPEIELGYTLATGDQNPDDSADNTFNPIFQDRHPRYGLSDRITASNAHIITAKGSIEVCEGARAGVGGYLFYAHRTKDQTAPSEFRPDASSGGSNVIGQELDLFLNMQLTENVSAQFAWAHFFPGGYVRNRFDSKDPSDRIYLNLILGL